jgi:nicotinamide-nucleotide amidase
MRAEIIGIGTEILLGQITNSNAQWMSERLAEIGIDVLHHQVVGDNEQRIADAFRLALSRADVVIATGGLGPTQDDITREGLAAALGVALVRRSEIEAFLREKFQHLGREMPESNLQQCDVPEGARYILPDRGTAPGLICETPERKRVYVVPGVPAEMREMMQGTILPELSTLSGPAAIVSRIVKATGIAEAKVAEMLDDLFRSSTNPTLAYLASSGEVKVRITAKADTPDHAEALLDPLADEVGRRLGDRVFTTDDRDLADVVGDLLKQRGKTVATAESMTAGTLAARLSWPPGASEYFIGGVVSYTAEVKQEVLGISAETLNGPGVVSEECAREMAFGARKLFGADIGMAITGAAGPEPHGGKPPGTVCISVAGEWGAESRTFRAPGDREQVRRWAEQGALDLARRYLENEPGRADSEPRTTASSR